MLVWLALRFRDWWDIVILLRVPVVLAAVALVLFTQVDQVLEAFRVLAENAMPALGNGCEWQPRNPILILCAAWLFALLQWYCARQMTYLYEADQIDLPTFRGCNVAWIPRGCGVAIFAGVGLGAWIAALEYPVDYCARAPRGDTCAVTGCEPELLQALAAACAISAAVFLWIVVMRRRGLATPVVPPEKQAKLAAMPIPARWILFGAILLGTVIFAITLVEPFFLARQVGSPVTLALLAFTSMLPIWLVIGYLGQRVRVPLITVVLAFAVLWSLLDTNDNHPLRMTRMAPGVAPSSADIASDFERWLRGRKDLDRYPVYPVVIVAAEGGGLRAGYFTAQVMGVLQDRCPLFAQHLYAVSAVSGGSVGATVFAGLARDYGRNVEDQPCDFGIDKDLPVAARAGRVLAHDLLTPMIATALYPDLVQRFVPRPFPSVDRALTLERTLERAWDRVREGKDGDPSHLRMTPGALSGSFYDLAANRADDALPALLLNTTHVESGNRMVISPITASGNALRGLDILADAVPKDDISASTAAFASARFPYVTPAAWVWRSPQQPAEAAVTPGRRMRYVDGGYYDNAGTATLSDVFEALRSFHPGVKRDGPALKPFSVTVIWIGNEPVKEPSFPATQPMRTSESGLGESMSPLRAVMNARSARSDESVRRLQHTVELTRETVDKFTARWVEFRLLDRGVPLPLGWLLSQNARSEIDAQLPRPEDCGESSYPLRTIEARHNACAFGEVIAQLVRGRR